jgi:hypothetical protein
MRCFSVRRPPLFIAPAPIGPREKAAALRNLALTAPDAGVCGLLLKMAEVCELSRSGCATMAMI